MLANSAIARSTHTPVLVTCDRLHRSLHTQNMSEVAARETEKNVKINLKLVLLGYG